MIEYSEQIRKTYSGMETEELLGRAKAGTLTEEAHVLAIEELQARGVPRSELPTQPSSLPTNDGIPTTESPDTVGILVIILLAFMSGAAISWLGLASSSDYSGFVL